MSENNIISFPLKNRNENTPENISEEELNSRKLIMQHYHVQEIVETLLPVLFTQLSLGGFNFDDETDIKETSFLVESLRAILCKKNGLTHPFHEIIDNVFDMTEPGVLQVVDKLNVNLINDGTNGETSI